jgi:putative ABC transport system permease protein
VNKIETLKLGFASMWAHKLRSFLTLLGLIIGVATLITVITIVEGANVYVQDKVISLGADSFQITKTPLIATDIDEFLDALRYKDLTMEDVGAINRGCPNCFDVGAEVARNGHVKSGSTTVTDVSIQGVTANMGEIGSLDIAQGRYLLPWEEEGAVSVCILGADVAEKLLSGVDPLGKTVKIDQHPCQVIGVADKIGSVLGQGRDNFAIIPIRLFFKLYGYHSSLRNLTITARAASPPQLQAAQDEARLVLRSRRHVAYQEKENFYISTADTLMSIWDDFKKAFFIAFILIASIAALVGGIVIMNIMLVTVAERTREIGLRKSLGARRQDILEQFFMEALMLCLMGGLIGIGLGFAVALLVNRYTPFPAVVQPQTVLVGIVVSSAVGLVFGLYPAWRAAALNPVEALRRE